MTELDIFADIDFSTTNNNSEKKTQPVVGGFNGIMEDVSLPDLIQLACLENKSRKLVIHSEEDTGEIYFKNGEVIHAITKQFIGEEAFYEILSWEEGNFKFYSGVSKEKSIDVPWNFLLIEALRQKDEKTAKSQHETSKILPKILIVDDSKFFTSRLKQLFKDEIGAKVIGEAKNGKEALNILANESPEIITLDINMPIMPGDVALKHIMIKSPAPVVLISNFNPRHTSKVMEFLRLGAVDFISKPTDASSWADFSQRLKEIVHNSKKFQVKSIRRARNPQKALYKNSPGMPAEHLIIFIGGIGGLLEIQKILPNLTLGERDGVLIFQDMCTAFLKPFSQYMDEFCSFSVKAMDKGAPILSSQAWVLNIRENYLVRADETGAALFIAQGHDNQDMIHDLFVSLAEIYRKDLIVIVLSGAKEQFLTPLYEVSTKGGIIFAQSPETSLYADPLEKLKTLEITQEFLKPDDIVRKIREITGSEK